MDNQHRKIKGYPELSQDEVDLMNRINTFGPQLEQLIDDLVVYSRGVRVGYHSQEPLKRGEKQKIDVDAVQAFDKADPFKWINEGRTTLQEGLMALTRAVARPTFF